MPVSGVTVSGSALMHALAFSEYGSWFLAITPHDDVPIRDDSDRLHRVSVLDNRNGPDIAVGHHAGDVVQLRLRRAALDVGSHHVGDG